MQGKLQDGARLRPRALAAAKISTRPGLTPLPVMTLADARIACVRVDLLHEQAILRFNDVPPSSLSDRNALNGVEF